MDQLAHKLMLGGNIFGYFTNIDETHEILRQAEELGVCAIDTADVYSNGLSEEIIGKYIRIHRKKWFIASKVGIFSHADPAGLGTKKNIIHRVEASLKRLQTDYLDLYQIHHYDPVTPLEETIGAFQELIAQGKILSAGISNFQTAHLESLKQTANHAFNYHQLALNITNYHEIKETVLASHPMQLIAYSSLVRGLFNEKYLKGTIPDHSRASISKSIKNDLTFEFINLLQKTFEVGSKYDASLPQIALQFVSRLPQVKFTIIGVRNLHQLTSAFLSLKYPAPSELFTEVEGIWRSYQSVKPSLL